MRCHVSFSFILMIIVLAGATAFAFLYNFDTQQLDTIGQFRASTLTEKTAITQPAVPLTATERKLTTKTYFYGNDLIASKQSSVVYYHNDYLGSTRVQTDSSAKKLFAARTLPFGSDIYESGNAIGSGNSYKFTGQEQDSNLYYYNARYYDTRTGRFTQIDPVLDSGSPYRYVSNNPLKFIDTSGTEELTPKQKETMEKIQTMSVSELDRLTGGVGRSSRAMTHYLLGSGEPMNFELSEDEWKLVIDQTEKYGWKPSTNPEYHHDQGWEYSTKIFSDQFKAFGGDSFDNSKIASVPQDLWNLLGQTTLRRRIENGQYHYMIVENFDFAFGNFDPSDRYSNFLLNFLFKGTPDESSAKRLVNENTAQFLKEYFQGIVKINPAREGGKFIADVKVKYVNNVGKSFKINAETFTPIKTQ